MAGTRKPQIHGERLWSSLMELARIGATPKGGVRRVTLAHNHCETHCTPGIYEQAWPVLFDPKSGACADVR